LPSKNIWRRHFFTPGNVILHTTSFVNHIYLRLRMWWVIVQGFDLSSSSAAFLFSLSRLRYATLLWTLSIPQTLLVIESDWESSFQLVSNYCESLITKTVISLQISGLQFLEMHKL
jgi:hypothetical protein